MSQPMQLKNLVEVNRWIESNEEKAWKTWAKTEEMDSLSSSTGRGIKKVMQPLQLKYSSCRMGRQKFYITLLRSCCHCAVWYSLCYRMHTVPMADVLQAEAAVYNGAVDKRYRK